MKLWVDDVRQAPDKTYIHAITVTEAKLAIQIFEEYPPAPLELIDMDHDAGEYAAYGGDYIKLLDWLEETGRSYPIRIHSQNPVGAENMRRIIRKNGWKEVL